MESTGTPGKVQVSKDTYDITKDKFKYEKRGKIEVKGKGQMYTYWLKGKRKEKSIGPDLHSSQPTHKSGRLRPSNSAYTLNQVASPQRRGSVDTNQLFSFTKTRSQDTPRTSSKTG